MRSTGPNQHTNAWHCGWRAVPLMFVLVFSIVPRVLGWIAGVLWQRIETGFSRGYRIAASAASPESADKGGAV